MQSIYTKTLAFVFLICSLGTNAQVYKWIDEEGNIHFGDSPPKQADAEPQEMPRFPSQKEVEKANIKLESMLKARRVQDSQEASTIEQSTTTESFPQNDVFDARDCDSSYFNRSRLSRRDPLYLSYNNGPGYETLSSEQAKLVRALYSKMKGSWRGIYVELDCSSVLGENRGIVGDGSVDVNVRWDRHSGQLTIQSEISDFPNIDSKTMMFYFELFDYLYFRDREGQQLNDDQPKILADGNRVNLFRLAESDLGFSLSRTHTRKSWAPGYTRQLTRVTGGTSQTNRFRVSSNKLDIVVRYSGNNIRIWHLNR